MGSDGHQGFNHIALMNRALEGHRPRQLCQSSLKSEARRVVGDFQGCGELVGSCGCQKLLFLKIVRRNHM